MVEEGADLFGRLVDAVAVVVEEGEEHLLASLAVTGLASRARLARERLYRASRLTGLVDAELAEPIVNRPELAFFAEDDPV